MKRKTKIAVTATAIAITSLMITTYHSEPQTPPVSPQIAPVSEVVAVDRATTPPPALEPIIAEKIAEIGTQKEEKIAPTNQQENVPNAEETSLPQPTEKEESTNSPTATSQTATKATSSEITTRTIDGKQQGYLIGFGWVDYMGENTCTTDYGMYENGNKVGTMGDINKIVGRMD